MGWLQAEKLGPKKDALGQPELHSPEPELRDVESRGQVGSGDWKFPGGVAWGRV